MDSKKILGNRLAQLRHDKGITQQQLANILTEVKNRKKGYSLLSVSGWESGDKYPPVDVVLALCELYNVTSDYLFGYDLKSLKPNDGSADYFVPYHDLHKYDQKPIYVKFHDTSHEDGWGIYDATKNRIVFHNKFLYPTEDIKCSYYSSIPDELMCNNPTQRRRLSMSQLMEHTNVWIEMITTSERLKGEYNGWFRLNETKTYLINSRGLTLPLDGLNVSYNAYPGT